MFKLLFPLVFLIFLIGFLNFLLNFLKIYLFLKFNPSLKTKFSLPAKDSCLPMTIYTLGKTGGFLFTYFVSSRSLNLDKFHFLNSRLISFILGLPRSSVNLIIEMVTLTISVKMSVEWKKKSKFFYFHIFLYQYNLYFNFYKRLKWNKYINNISTYNLWIKGNKLYINPAINPDNIISIINCNRGALYKDIPLKTLSSLLYNDYNSGQYHSFKIRGNHHVVEAYSHHTWNNDFTICYMNSLTSTRFLQNVPVVNSYYNHTFTTTYDIPNKLITDLNNNTNYIVSSLIDSKNLNNRFLPLIIQNYTNLEERISWRLKLLINYNTPKHVINNESFYLYQNNLRPFLIPSNSTPYSDKIIPVLQDLESMPIFNLNKKETSCIILEELGLVEKIKTNFFANSADLEIIKKTLNNEISNDIRDYHECFNLKKKAKPEKFYMFNDDGECYLNFEENVDNQEFTQKIENELEGFKYKIKFSEEKYSNDLLFNNILEKIIE